MSRFSSVPRKKTKSSFEDEIREMGVDRISDLPMNVIDSILTKLPLKDAVKTSILSRNWRDNWTSLSQLVFHSGLGWTRDIESTIYRVLSRHSCAAIDKFELDIFFRPKFYDLDQWMLILRDRAIKDFCLQFSVYNGRYKLHSCLFSCQLTSLALHYCVFQPPPTFKGFKNLKFLHLKEVTVHNDVLNSLMGSDQLERVHLQWLDGINLLRIHSPNLKFLQLDDAFDDICLAKSPALHTLNIYWSAEFHHQRLKRAPTHHNLVSFLGSLPAIKTINLWGPFFDFLATSGTIPQTLPLTINRLEFLSLHQVNFNVDDISAVLAILKSSPNLKILIIRDFNKQNNIKGVNKFLKEECLQDCCFSQLQHVQMPIFINRRPATGLIKFILARSPLLSSMHIRYFGDDKGSLEKEVLLFERASP